MSFKVQYGESDFAFISRTLEEAGVAYVFGEEGDSSVLELHDALHDRPARGGPPLPFVAHPPPFVEECVHDVHLSQDVRPEAYTLRDYDLRHPKLPLVGVARTGPAALHEHYDYRPGGSTIELPLGGGTLDIASAMLGPGDAIHDITYANLRAQKTLSALREGEQEVGLTTNAIDLKPGSVFHMTHPHPRLSGKLLVTRLAIEGSVGGEWTMKARAVFADEPYRPPRVTPRPRVFGVQSAVMVGPPGEDVFTDELGRCCVKFPWDRRLTIGSGNASCWLRDAQGWKATSTSCPTRGRCCMP
jgi:type VI secretion system secreted protein VgrG